MDAQATGGFLRFFHDLPDPRAGNCIHNLCDIFAIAICAVICGAEGWVDVELFALSKQTWLSTFLDLSHGIPSHDTFGRVFARIDPSHAEHNTGYTANRLTVPTTNYYPEDALMEASSLLNPNDKTSRQ